MNTDKNNESTEAKHVLGEVDCLKCKVYDVCKFIHQWTNYDYKHEGVFEGSTYKSFLRRRKIDGCDYFS